MNEVTTHAPRQSPSENVASDANSTTRRSNDVDSAQQIRQESPVDWQGRAIASHPYQLLPIEFVQRQTSRKIIQIWSAVVFILLASLCGLASSFWSRSHRASSIHAKLIARSEPVLALQNNYARLQQENIVVGQWIDVVNSAKPDDSALQVLLAIAESTSQSDSAVAIESIDMKLPLEYLAEAGRPKWAEPKLTVEASLPFDNQRKANGNAPMDKLTQTLTDSGRAAGVRWRKVGDENDRVILRINGQPIATRMVP